MANKIETVTIKKGDTLSKIAKNYNTDVDKIMEMNKDTIKNKNLIYEGQQIKISNEIETVDLLPKAELKSPLGVNTVGPTNSRDMSYVAQTKAINDFSNKANHTTHEDVIARETAQAMSNKQTEGSSRTIDIHVAHLVKPDAFSFKHEDSNILAAKAKNMGFTDDQILIAIGISRWETGNYQHLAGGFNYGGVTGKGDAGSFKQYANYSTKDIGMDAFLNNLKKNYFDQGYSSVEGMARKYLGYDDTSNWIKGVKGCIEKGGIYKA